MKFGYRTPSISKTFKARTTGRAKRSMFDSSAIKNSVTLANDLYGVTVKNKDYAGYCEVADQQLLGFKWLATIIILPFLPMLWLISKIHVDCKIVYTSRYYLDMYKRILHSKAFKVFAVLAVICNPNLLLIVAPAYGIYRLCIKNRKAPATTESKEEDQKQVEYTEVKSTDDIQL